MKRVVTVFALAVAVGCGVSDGGAGGTSPPPKPVSKKELRALLDDVGLEIGVAFHRVDEAGEGDETEQLRRTLLRAADTEERQAQRLERVIAPQAARRPLAQLVRATREQAKDIRALAHRKDLSGEVVRKDSLREDVSDKQIDRALDELENVAPPPRAGG